MIHLWYEPAWADFPIWRNMPFDPPDGYLRVQHLNGQDYVIHIPETVDPVQAQAKINEFLPKVDALLNQS